MGIIAEIFFSVNTKIHIIFQENEKYFIRFLFVPFPLYEANLHFFPGSPAIFHSFLVYPCIFLYNLINYVKTWEGYLC